MTAKQSVSTLLHNNPGFIMNFDDLVSSIPRRQQSLSDTSQQIRKFAHMADEILRCCTEDSGSPHSKNSTSFHEETAKKSPPRSDSVSPNASPSLARSSRKQLSSSSTTTPRRQCSRRRSFRNLSNYRSCSLPTIAEYQTSCFDRETSVQGLRAYSCQSLRGRGSTSSKSKSKKPKRSSWNVSHRGCSTNSRFESTSRVGKNQGSSITSRTTTLVLLQDLHLSEKKKESLVTSLQRQQTQGTIHGRDSILAPPQRISSNAIRDVILDVSDHSKAAACAEPNADFTHQQVHDRFAPILSTPTVARTNKSDDNSPSSSCHRRPVVDFGLPRIPRRPASPIHTRNGWESGLDSLKRSRASPKRIA